MTTFVRLLVFTFVLASCTQAWALDILAPADLKPALEEASAVASADVGAPVKASCYDDTFEAAKAAIGSCKADIFIAADEQSFHDATVTGLVAAPGKTIFYKRLALGVPLKNPRRIFGIEELGQPGVRLAVEEKGKGLLGALTDKVIENFPQREAVRKNIVVQASGPDAMVKSLAAHEADAVLCWDTLEPRALGKIAIMRLPWTVSPTQTCCAAVTRTAADPSAASKLLDFLCSDKMQSILFAKGFWLESGKDGGMVMERVAAGAFAPMYPLLAKQIVDDYKTTEGVCVDIGCGPGQLPIELAKITHLQVWGVDIEPQALELARGHAREASLSEDRVRFVAGDAHALPLPDNSADLVVSRGTLPFLRDKALAFKEAYRILKPGGVAFMGGGFSRYQSPESVEQMRQVSGEGESAEKKRCMKMDYPAILREAGMTNYRLIRDNGMWVELRK